MNTLGYAHTFPSEVPPSPPPSSPLSVVEAQRRSLPEGYQIVDCLGRGGCAVVYEAWHAEHGNVAIKISDVPRASAGEADKRLEREALLAQRVSHPNVLEVYDLGHMDDGSPFLVMERLRGEDLECTLERVGPLPLAVACEIVLETLRGLEAVHAAGIIHRDLKPNNIILHTPDNWGAPIVKLIDFGVARGVDAEKLTRTGTVIGTPQYLAPEQAKGQKVDVRADIWAMGILFYELLVGAGPFESSNLQETLASILFADVASVREHRHDVPDVIAHVIAKALRREASERYASATEMREALERAIWEACIVAAPGTLFAVSVLPKQSDTPSYPSFPSLGGADTISGVRMRPSLTPDPAELDEVKASTTRRNRIGALLMSALLLIVVFAINLGAGTQARSREAGATQTASVRSTTRGSQTAVHVLAASSQAAHADVVPTATPTTSGARRSRQLVSQARSALSRGHVDEAYTLFDAAKDLDPRSQDAWRGFGQAAYERGSVDEARRAMRRYRSLAE